MDRQMAYQATAAAVAEAEETDVGRVRADLLRHRERLNDRRAALESESARVESFVRDCDAALEAVHAGLATFEQIEKRIAAPRER